MFRPKEMSVQFFSKKLVGNMLQENRLCFVCLQEKIVILGDRATDLRKLTLKKNPQICDQLIFFTKKWNV